MNKNLPSQFRVTHEFNQKKEFRIVGMRLLMLLILTSSGILGYSQTTIGGVNMGNLTNYLFVFTDGNGDANWQGATKGFCGNVAIDGVTAKEKTSGSVPFAGTIYTNATSLSDWSGIVDQNDPGQVNPAQAFGVTNQTSLISNLKSDLNNAFSQINALPASSGYSSVSSTSLNGLNKQNNVNETFVINITSGLSVSSKINITGDAGDVFILRWDSDGNPNNGYQGQAKFQSGGAVVPLGGLKPSNFINVAGDINSSGGGSNPAAPYPQGPRTNDGTGSLISNSSNFSGGGFFTGYWLTTGKPSDGKTSSLSNGIFVGGWYSTTTKFSMTSGTSGVYCSPNSPCAGQGGDSDGDGVCNNQDCQPNNAAIPATPGTACNDGNPNTTNDVIQANGCTCAGTPVNPCASQGGDSDGDGICNNQDCQPNNPAFPATPGTLCNDGNPNTSNDVVQAGGCSCAGTPVNNGPNCATDITITTGNGTITVTGLGGAPISSLQVFSSTWQPIYSCFANCGASQSAPVPAGSYYVYAKYYTAGYQLICEKQLTVTVTGGSPCANQGGDTDGDGVCNNQDCQPNNAALPAAPGTACNDANPNTTNDIIQADGCSCAGTPVSTCDNVTNGGTIGFGTNCAATTTLCNTAAPSITDCTAPSGGSGNLEVIWLKSTTSCSMPTTTAAQIIAGQDPHWTLIPGQTGLTYNPGTVSASTCYLRCTRRAGCGSYMESNIISLTVNCNGGGGTPDCANINIATTASGITVTGLAGAPVSSLQVFSSTWQPIYSCFANCGASQTVSAPAGNYYVYAKFYSAGYALICEKNLTVTVGGAPAATVVPADQHPKFVNALPSPPRINAMGGGTYNIGMEESSQYLGLFDSNGSPVNTTTWGYSYNGNKMYLGPTFITKKDVPVDVKWINNLGTAHDHLLPVDHSIHMAHPTNGVATVVHLHGGHVESASDGYPEAWFTQNWAEKGAEFKKQTYHYTNDQEAGTLWYHDHALGITRLNVYAGLAGMYLLRDNNELSMNLPTGNYERELIVQDKQFSTDGSMYFPALLSDPEAADFPTNPAIEPTIFPEFFGNYILVNGMVWPKLDVQPTKYRFRVLNASDSRFYIFKLSNNANFQQIGTEGGFLNSPVTLNQLILAPGERADIVIDFASMAGQSVTLLNFGPDMPFMGLAAAQMPADPATTGQIMRFNVGTSATASFTIPNTLRQPIQYLGQETKTRQLLLLEGTDEFGRLMPSLGTAADGALGWMDPTTENPVINETEVWEIYNNTGDAHPIHVHQVMFQLLDRQEFTGDLDPITSQLTNIQLVGAPIAPEANEMGWKDTYIIPPGHVARYKVKFDLAGKFVWHCHILSHEDHDMMRPFEVLPAGGGGGGTGTPNCANVSITAMPGMIHVMGLGGAPVTSLQVFTSSWQPQFSCFADCGATKMVPVAAGSYYVYVKYYDAAYQQICEVTQTVNVPAALTGVAGEVFNLYPNKYLEHAEISWIHNAGNLVSDYELERSLDGVNFESLGALASKGGSSAEFYSNYDFEPATGDNFYRVKLHLSNGTEAYSEVAMLHYDDLEDYTLFPNPANNFVNINLEKAVGAEDVNIQVFNNLGILLKRFDIDEVTSKFFQMDVRELHEGHYIVWVNVPGKRAIPKQLVIGKL